MRTADHPIDPDIVARWSPRSFDGSPLAFADLAPLFEAARWAPSASNHQPWRFAYSLRGDGFWDEFLNCLAPMNAVWAGRASALVILLSDRYATLPGKDQPVLSATASFDAGAAWSLLALQGAKLGLATHAMAGFDRERAGVAAGAGENFKPEAMIAIGRRGPASDLPDALRAREAPSPRRPITGSVFHGPIRA